MSSHSSETADSFPVGPVQAMILAITATAVSVNSLILPSLSEIMAGVGASDDRAGLIAATATLPGILLAPVMGLLSDRYGRREVIVPCLIVFGLAGGLAGTSSSLTWLVVWRLVQGIGVAGLINLAVTLIGDNWSGVKRAKMLGRNVAMLMAGLSVFPLLGGLLTDAFGWRAPFAMFPLSVITALVVAKGLPKSTRVDVDLKAQLRALGPALRGPYVTRALLATAVVFFVVFGVFLTLVPLYLADHFGVGPSTRGLILAAPALPNMLSALSTGRLPITPTQSMTLGTLLLIGALALVATAATVPLLIVGMLLFGTGEGLVMPNIHFITTGVAASSRGSVVALYTSAKGVGQTAGPPLGSGIYAAHGAPAAAWGALAICAVILLPLLATPASTRERDATPEAVELA